MGKEVLLSEEKILESISVDRDDGVLRIRQTARRRAIKYATFNTAIYVVGFVTPIIWTSRHAGKPDHYLEITKLCMLVIMVLPFAVEVVRILRMGRLSDIIINNHDKSIGSGCQIEVRRVYYERKPFWVVFKLDSGFMRNEIAVASFQTARDAKILAEFLGKTLDEWYQENSSA